MYSTLLIWNILRELISSLYTITFYAWFAKLRYRCPIYVRRVAICTGINFLCHVYTRIFIPREVVAYMLTAVDLIAITRILWHPRRGFAYWSAFFLCFCTDNSGLSGWTHLKQYLKTDSIRFFVNCPDAAAVCLRTGFRHCQSDAVAAFFPGTGFISSAKALEQSLR